MKLPLLVLFWSSWFGIVYTYVIFPVLLRFISAVAGPKTSIELPPESDDQLPRVAMIVAAYNEGAVISQKLENTWAIDYPGDRFSIVIGSDGSTDDTNEILRNCSDNRLTSFLFGERRGKISVLNNLVAQTDADIIVMSDANTMYQPDAVRKLVREFGDKSVGCVSGKLVIEQNGGVSGEGLYWKYENWIKVTESKLGFLMGCNGGIFALRRELYSQLPASTIVEDFVLTLRVIEQGYKVRKEPLATASEPPCATSRAEMVRKIRIGAGGWQALTLVPGLLHPRQGLRAFALWGHKVLRWLVPVLMLVNLAANIGLARMPFYAFMLALQVTGLAIACVALTRSWEHRMPRLLRPVSYYYLMNYSLLAGLVRFLTKTQRVTWERGTTSRNLDVADRRDASAPAK